MALRKTSHRAEDRSNGGDKGRNGCLFVISAPSGAGKTTLCKRILNRFPEMRYSVSYTTRTPRAGEVEGKDYHFISRAEFEEMIREDRWAEWAKVHDNYYGTSADLLKTCMDAGYDVLLDIDVAGAQQIRRHFSDSIHIFIMPPSMAVLKERLLRRSSDDPDEIEKRLKAAEREMAHREIGRAHV